MSEDGPRYVIEPLTDERVEKVARYVSAGWKISTAMSQCDIARSQRAELERRLNAIGVREQVLDEF